MRYACPMTLNIIVNGRNHMLDFLLILDTVSDVFHVLEEFSYRFEQPIGLPENFRSSSVERTNLVIKKIYF